MEEVKEFKYLGTVLCKHGDDCKKKISKGKLRKAGMSGSLARVMRGKNISSEEK